MFSLSVLHANDNEAPEKHAEWSITAHKNLKLTKQEKTHSVFSSSIFFRVCEL